MQKNILTVFVALVLTACGTQHFDSKEFESLQQAFRNPPQSAKPMVWWHWMNGNITPEGLRSDILWMHRAGIGGFHVFDVRCVHQHAAKVTVGDDAQDFIFVADHGGAEALVGHFDDNTRKVVVRTNLGTLVFDV